MSDRKKIKLIFSLTFVVVSLIFIFKLDFKVHSQIEQNPYCSQPGTVGAVFPGTSPIPKNTAPDPSCNPKLFTNHGYCHLSSNLISVYDTVGQMLVVPPAYLAAEKRQESGPNCIFNETQSGQTNVQSLELIYYPDTNPQSPGPFQFLPSTWQGFIAQVTDVINGHFPFAKKYETNQSVFLPSMIGASIYLRGLATEANGGTPINSLSQWTTTLMLDASAGYNSGTPNYGNDPGYADSVHNFYEYYLSVCNFATS